MSVCRTCQAPMTWAVTEGGRRMPLDPPSEDGNVVLYRGTAYVYRDAETALRAVKDGSWAGAVTRHLSHFVTCPQADEHRRG